MKQIISILLIITIITAEVRKVTSEEKVTAKESLYELQQRNRQMKKDVNEIKRLKQGIRREKRIIRGGDQFKNLFAVSDQQNRKDLSKIYKKEMQKNNILQEQKIIQRKIYQLLKYKKLSKHVERFSVQSLVKLMIRLGSLRILINYHQYLIAQQYILKKINKGELDFQYKCLISRVIGRAKKGQDSIAWLHKELQQLFKSLTYYVGSGKGPEKK